MAPGLGAYRPLSSTIDSPMSRAPARFTQRDLARAIKGAVAGGLTVQRVEVDKAGKIVVIVGEPGKADAVAPNNSWDSV
jgi:hypothetical protein